MHYLLTIYSLIFLASFQGDPNLINNVTLEINEDQYHANTGCNGLSGKVTINNDSIAFSDGPMTKRFCPDDGLENLFVQTLLKVDSFSEENNQITFFSNGNEVMKMKTK